MTNEHDLIRRGDVIAAFEAWRQTQDGHMQLAMRFHALPAVDLSDPVTVHANMLRGTIANPSIEHIIHIYGADAIRAALPAVAADLAAVPAQVRVLAMRDAGYDTPTDPRDEVIARLVEALEWYANSANWCDTPDWDGPDTCTKAAVPFRIEEEMGPMICDCGDTARAALAAAKAVQR